MRREREGESEMEGEKKEYLVKMNSEEMKRTMGGCT